MTILCGGIVIVWLVGCVWLIWQFCNAPAGDEIPERGFVEVDDDDEIG